MKYTNKSVPRIRLDLCQLRRVHDHDLEPPIVLVPHSVRSSEANEKAAENVQHSHDNDRTQKQCHWHRVRVARLHWSQLDDKQHAPKASIDHIEPIKMTVIVFFF